MLEAVPDIAVDRWLRIPASPNTELVKVWGRGHPMEPSAVRLLVTTDQGTSTARPLPDGAGQSPEVDRWTWGFAISRLDDVQALTFCAHGVARPLLAQGRDLAAANRFWQEAPAAESTRANGALQTALSTERRRRLAAEQGKDLASTELGRVAGRLVTAEGQAEHVGRRLAAQPQLSTLASRPDAVAPTRRSVRRGAKWRAPVSVGIAALGLLATAGALLDRDDSSGRASSDTQRPPRESARAPTAQGSVATIPARYLDAYQAAGRTYALDWTMLAAVGMAESDHGRSPDAGVRTGQNGRGAIGPAQFLQATWERFGVDANANGIRSPYEPVDAIAAMASYLRAEGAPDDWRSALFTYNPDRSYVDRVLREARRIRYQAQAGR